MDPQGTIGIVIKLVLFWVSVAVVLCTVAGLCVNLTRIGHPQQRTGLVWLLLLETLAGGVFIVFGGINSDPQVVVAAIEKPWKDKNQALNTELAEANIVLRKVAEVKEQEINRLTGQIAEIQKQSAPTQHPEVQVSQTQATHLESGVDVEKVEVEESTPQLTQAEEIVRLSAQIADLTKKKYQLALRERIGLSEQMRRFLYAPVPQEAAQRRTASEASKTR